MEKLKYFINMNVEFNGDDEFETPTPCDDDENKNISHHMKCHSLPQKVNNNSPLI